MSRQSRRQMELAAVEAMRGWQTDQDIFDDAVAAYAGLNRTDTRVIDIVDRHGPITAGQLATEARLTSGAVTAVVDRLENAGLVRRVHDTVDRRRVMVQVTPKVAELMAPVFGPVAEEGYRRMAEYTDEEAATIMDFMVRNRDFLARHTARVHELIAAREREKASGE